MPRGFTESTLLDVVDDEGRSGFMLRIARHVDEGVAWLWLVTYGPDGVHGFVDDSFPCDSRRTPDERDRARYAVDLPKTHGLVGWIERTGAPTRVDGGLCEVRVNGHHHRDVPRGPGPVKMAVSAAFTALFGGAGSNLPGRTESIVKVKAVIEIDGKSRVVNGFGQFHEQLQDAPRFDTPFTYVSLRGDANALVALRGPRAGGGVKYGHASVSPFGGFQIEPYDAAESVASRQFRGGESGDSSFVTSGVVTPTVTYSVPILEGRRPSAVVSGILDGSRVTGFVNDWVPPIFGGNPE
jgi:hypothetical protein